MNHGLVLLPAVNLTASFRRRAAEFFFVCFTQDDITQRCFDAARCLQTLFMSRTTYPTGRGPVQQPQLQHSLHVFHVDLLCWSSDKVLRKQDGEFKTGPRSHLSVLQSKGIFRERSFFRLILVEFLLDGVRDLPSNRLNAEVTHSLFTFTMMVFVAG